MEEKCVNCGKALDENSKCTCKEGPKCVDCCECDESCEGNCKTRSKEHQEG